MPSLVHNKLIYGGQGASYESCLCRTKPLPAQMITNFSLDHQEHMSMKFYAKLKHCHPNACEISGCKMSAISFRFSCIFPTQFLQIFIIVMVSCELRIGG